MRWSVLHVDGARLGVNLTSAKCVNLLEPGRVAPVEPKARIPRRPNTSDLRSDRGDTPRL
jgi:hypothetical protein